MNINFDYLFSVAQVIIGDMYRVCSLQLGPNFGVQPATGKNFYLQLMVEKMSAFSVFTDKFFGRKAEMA